MPQALSTFPSYHEPCGWQALLPLRIATPSLASNVTADLVVVGAGYTGLAAARTWADAHPDDRVIVVDSSVVGEGSPGRDSGFMLRGCARRRRRPGCGASDDALQHADR